MILKRILLYLFSIAFLLHSGNLKADHNAGGELTWECITSGTNAGKFIFTLKLYRFCEGIGLGSSAYVASNSPVTSMTLNRIIQQDISPKCYDSTKWMDCYGSNSANTIDEHIYTSTPIQITGIPPATGWTFYWSSCCRPAPAIYGWGALMDNLEPQNQSYMIRATMFPYNGTNTSTCYDSSPKFSEKPATIICTGYPFTYNHNAVDVDMDSLTYEWTAPLLSSGTSVTYATNFNTSQVTPRPSGGNFIVPSPGFSATVPLPWAHSNMSTANVPASIDLYTGEINFTSYTKGQYATAILVKAFRCGTKIAEIMRDMPIILLSCPPTPTIPPLSNTPPQVTFKWNPSAVTSIPLPAGDTVWAGDSVSFYITSIDVQFLPGFVGQTNYLIPGGSQFGTGFSNPNSGCLYPPCATMDVSSIYFKPAKQWWEGQYGVAANFGWKTSCNHLKYVDSCFTRSNKYNFVFKVLDNWCPAPGSNFQTFTVTVLAPPAIPAPKLKCSRVLPNGNVLLSWDQPITKTKDTLNSFRKYIIYRADSANGSYDTLHIVLDIDSLSFLDVTANALTLPKYYVIQGISSCNDQSVRNWSDTIASLVLTSQTYNSGGSVALDWTNFNPANKWGNKTTGKYYVWQIVNSDTLLADSTTKSWDSLEVQFCYPTSVTYFVTVEDTSKYWGCTSYSNTQTELVGDITAPAATVLDSISYDLSNTIHFGWTPTSADIDKFFIYKGTVVIDSIPITQTSYSYTPTTNDSCALTFSVRSRDTCNNSSSPGIGQTSMCLKLVDVVRCKTNKKIIMSWEIYNPTWTSGPAWQYIYRSDNAGPFVYLDSVSPFTNQYSDTTINGNTTYGYRVRSWETGQGSGSWTTDISYTVDKLIDSTIVPAPEIRCVSWTGSNALKLEWNQPVNPDSNLNKYLIYHSTTGLAGSYSVLDSITGIFTSDNLAWSTIDYTHTGAGSGSPHYYYIVSFSGCDGQQPSVDGNIVRSIDLVVTSTSDSTNQLDWNKVSGTMMAATYKVYRDSVQIATPAFNNETATDKWVVCNEQVDYFVEYPDGTGRCTSTSRTINGFFRDDTPPAKQFVDSVSMLQDSTFTPLIGWSPNTSPGIVNYLILNCQGTKILDTVPSSVFSYTDLANVPVTGVAQYSVTAVDSCGNSGLTNMDLDCHNNIYVNPRPDICNKQIALTWEAYDDFTSGTNVEYRVYTSIDGGPFTLDQKTTENSAKINNPTEGSYYCFYIQAWENGGLGPFSSSSAVRCLRYNGIKAPDYTYLRYATVDDSNVVRLCLKIDTKSDLGEYWIRRSADPNANYQVISTVVVPDPITQADSNFCYEDKLVDTDKKSYYYYIDVADPCGNVTGLSNKARTIRLQVRTDREKNWNMLTWNEYSEWFGQVDKYHIYRRVNNGPMKLVESLSTASLSSYDEVSLKGDEITFRDDVSKEPGTGDGQFCYLIAAEEGQNTFRSSEPEVSKSNIVCADQNPVFYSPNSFTPNGDGLNDKFMPALAFYNVKSFEMSVYNRWGDRIYQTEDPVDGGWDGSANGKPAPDGAYIYIVKYKASDGQDYEEKGTVTLTR